MPHALATSPRQAWWLATRIRASQADAHKYQLRENSNLYSSSTASTVTSQRPLPLLATCLRAGGADLKPLHFSAANGWLLPPPSAARMHTAIIAKSSLLRPSCEDCAGLSTLAACAQVRLCYDCTPPLLLSSCCRHLCWPPATCAQQHSRCRQRKCRPPFSAGRMREATPLR